MPAKIPGGFVPIPRRARHEWYWTKPKDRAAYLDLMFRFNFARSVFHCKGTARGVNPGQAVVTVHGLASSWGWHRRRVRNFLWKLQADEVLVVSAVNVHHNRPLKWPTKKPHHYLMLTLAAKGLPEVHTGRRVTDRPPDRPPGRPTSEEVEEAELRVPQGEQRRKNPCPVKLSALYRSICSGGNGDVK